MRSPYLQLKERISTFGNHHQKFLHIIESQKDLLINRLEEKGLIDQVHLWQSAGTHLAEEIDLIWDVGKTDQEKLNFLGCYYATQFLLMNLRAVDILRLNLTSGFDKMTEYRSFMQNIGLRFRHLTSLYMKKLLDLYIPESDRPEFAICSVGTRADQDDIDVGIIDDGSPGRFTFNRAIGRLQIQMMKSACRLDMYLSEHVGTQLYSASINEYDALLKEEIHDFVIITEMLGAALILGSSPLFEQFRHQITDRYYFKKNGTNIYHEGYLRGILGEVRSLLIHQIQSDSINPKNDALRMIKGIIFVSKTIYGIQQVNAWEILHELYRLKPESREIYTKLEHALSFMEIFRFLYQLYVVQEEKIRLNDNNQLQNLELVAEIMGYTAMGAKNARDYFLVHYYEHQQSAKRTINILLEEIADHLRAISSFRGMLYRSSTQASESESPMNLVDEFINRSRFFRGTKFWDDALDEIQKDDHVALKRIIHDFNQLDSSRRKIYIRKLAQVGNYSFYTLISFLALLAKNRKRFDCTQFFEELSDKFLSVFVEAENRISRIVRIYHYYPSLLNSFIMALSEDKRQLFLSYLEGDAFSEEVVIVRERLKHLCELYVSYSRYFRRFFLNVINKYPNLIEYVDNTVKLKQIAKGFSAAVEYLTDVQEKKQKLGDSYDVDFLRLGLETLKGADISVINDEFTEFSDIYLQELFNTCKAEIEQQYREPILKGDILALFAAGGRAREQAFDDDLDLIVLLNSDSEELRDICSKIIIKMNRELGRHGIIPQYRLAEHFGSYVTRMSELEKFFIDKRDKNAFIEKSQLLGARMIAGSSRFEKEFKERFIWRFIFNQREQFIDQMVAEIKSRHQYYKPSETYLDVKEGVGGLRDIEMILLILKSIYRLDEPVNQKIMEHLRKLNPRCEEKMTILENASTFLKQVRDIYRLAITAENIIYVSHVDRIARIMGFTGNRQHTPGRQFLVKYRQTTEVVKSIVDEVINRVNSGIEAFEIS
ncbi:hypothetical protein JXJ21_06905 [candidate division KSB1 bacterium]|nr:hypothetical protein [candidate division KSB1 bacterium]